MSLIYTNRTIYKTPKKHLTTATMKNTIGIIITILGIGILGILDFQDRHETHLPKYFSESEETFFIYHKTVEESQSVIKSNWQNPESQFPREKVKTIKFYQNSPFISRLTSKELTDTEKAILIEIINDPNNFTWGETTWGIGESHYFFRFFNEQDKEIGKLWVCDTDCGMTEIRPWIPATKYGGLSQIGRSKITDLVRTM